MKKARYWPEATRALRQDKTLRRIIDARPAMQLQSRGTAFATLARAIVGQQISVKAAQSVWKRVVVCCDGNVTAAKIGRLEFDVLRSCGLSGQKVGYLFDLATHFNGGRIRPRRFAALPDQEIIDALVAVKGIGRWSAEMFLMFHLLRPNIWPVEDLGLRNAIDRAWPARKPRTKAQYYAVGDAFAPWRSVACWYLWRSLEPTPDDY